jgi:hypothetical protein
MGTKLGWLAGLMFLLAPVFWLYLKNPYGGLTLERLAGGALWTFLLAGPAVFPIMIGAAWGGGLAAAWIDSRGSGEASISRQQAALWDRYGGLMAAALRGFTYSLAVLFMMYVAAVAAL